MIHSKSHVVSIIANPITYKDVYENLDTENHCVASLLSGEHIYQRKLLSQSDPFQRYLQCARRRVVLMAIGDSIVVDSIKECKLTELT